MMNLVCLSCPWLVLAPKVLQLCTNHFVLVLCRPVWVSKAYQFFLVPSRSSNTPLYPSKVLRAKERAPTPYSSTVFYLGLTFEPLFSVWDSHLNPSRSWEHVKDSNSQSGNSLGSVRIHSLTLSYTPKSMRCDFQACFLAHNLASPCLGREPKARVVTISFVLVFLNANVKPLILFLTLLVQWKIKHQDSWEEEI